MTSKAKSRIVGIDFGLVRIGIALSDELKMIASPLFRVTAEKKSEQTVTKLMAQLEKHAQDNRYQIEEIVVGLPLLMSGKKGMLADEVAYFIELLKQKTAIPIVTWDERLTSVQAERSLRETSLTRKKRSQVVDTVAATLILQSFLDHKTRDLHNPLH